MLNYTILLVKKCFPPATFERGLSYHRQGRIYSLQVDPVNKTITALVRGSRRELYHVSVEINEDFPEDPFDGVCDCPIGFQCKHMVALLLEAFNHPALKQKQVRINKPSAPELDSQFKHWLIQLEQSTKIAIPEQKVPETHDQILYILSNKMVDHLRVLEVKGVRVSKLKSGAYGKPQRLAHTAISQQQYFTEEDEKIFYELELSLRRKRAYGLYETYISYELKDERDAKILKRMIKTQRCHWSASTGANLKLGKKRQLYLDWKIQENGHQELIAQAEGKNIIVFPLADPWYFDPETKTCGHLDSLLPAATLQLLMNTPTIQPENLAAIRKTLEGFSQHADIPLPKLYSTNHIEQTKPTPCLTLLGITLKNHYETKNKIPVAALSFLYGGLSVSWSEAKNPLHHWTGESLVTYLRDQEAENQALKMLIDIKLMTISDIYSDQLGATKDYFMLEQGGLDPITFGRIHLPQLEKSGWKIIYDKTFTYELLNLEKSQWYTEITETSGEPWFEVELGIDVDGERINLLPLLHDFLQHPSAIQKSNDGADYLFQLANGKHLALSKDRIEKMLHVLTELYQDKPLTDFSTLRLSRYNAGRIFEIEALHNNEALSWHWEGGKKIRALAEKLKSFKGIQEIKLPKIFHGKLRPYQHVGLNWLQFLREHELNGILADDMGLGKTIQTLAHILIEKKQGRLIKPCLIVAPTSLMFNWKNEAARFTPDLNVLILQGMDRKKYFSALKDYDIVLTTYALVVRDEVFLLKEEFYFIILDEAQAIKNANSQVARILPKMKTSHRLCLTGTPLENHLGELWSLFHFLMPGFLGNQQQFQRLYRHPIEKQLDNDRQQQLIQRISPFVLRRTKEEVLKELPPKVETTQYIALNEESRDLYETIRLSLHQKITQQIKQQGINKSQIVILDALLKLRQICCDSRLLKINAGKSVKQKSAKLNRLMELITELIADGNRKILIYSQFVEMLELIEVELKAHQINYVKLTGQTKNREEVVKAFQEGETPLFLLSLKAGGVGLNLTAADTVIHYDPWWNPAVERQATDRAHRMGQNKKVFVYKLVAKGTVEERILHLQERKKALIDNVINQSSQGHFPLTSEELMNLFAPLA